MNSECMIANYSKGAGLLLVETELSNDRKNVRLVGQENIGLNIDILRGIHSDIVALACSLE